MNHKLMLWAVSAALVATITGCNSCNAADAANTQAPAKTPAKATMPPTAANPQKAVTPDGEVFWIVAEWDACCTPGPKRKCKPCPTARCWKTSNGKILCVKPLKKCPTNGKNCSAAEHYHSQAQHVIMCTQDNPAQPCPANFAAKEVKPCPANGAAPCNAKEHVNLPDGKKGCSKADCAKPGAKAKTQAAAQVIPMEESFESNEVFEITSIN